MEGPSERRFPTIAGFELEAEIGRGGFAVVYRATQPRLGRNVAVKVIATGNQASPDTLARFERECRAIGSLTGHPTVVTVFEVGTTQEGDPFLAMEYLPGGSLQERLDRGPLPWSEVVEAGIAVADALAAAHELDILHRDVKPANVLTDRFGRLRLADFGIAGLASSTSTTLGSTAATVAYAAPEVLLGQRATPASDLYGLGATLYALLMGSPAFFSATDESVVPMMLRVTEQPLAPVPPEVAPDGLRALLVDLMAKLPDLRPPSASATLERLLDLRPGGGTTAPVPPRTDPHVTAPLGPPTAPTPIPEPPTAPDLAAAAGPAPPFGPRPGDVPPTPPPPSVTPPGAPARGRGRLAAAAVVVVLALVAAGVFVATRRGKDDQVTAGSTTTLAASTTTTGSIASGALTTAWASVALSGVPVGVAEVGDLVWTAADAGADGTHVGRLIGLDKATGAVKGDIAIDAVPGAIRPLGTVIYGADNFSNQIVSYDGVSGKPISTHPAPGNPTDALPVGADIWWPGSSTGDVTHVRARNGEFIGADTVVHACDKAQVLAAGFGAVWATCPSQGVVARIDVTTGKVDLVATGGAPVGITVAAESVWVADSDRHQVLRIDPDGLKVAEAIPVRGQPWKLASNRAGVWASDRTGTGAFLIVPGTEVARASRAVSTKGSGISAIGSDGAAVADQTGRRIVLVTTG